MWLKLWKILLALAGAEIHAKPIGVDGACHARIVHRLFGRADREPRVPAALFPSGRVFAVVGDRPVADLGRNPRRKVAGVEQRRVIDARTALFQVGPQLGHGRAQRRHTAHSGYNNSSSHGEYLFRLEFTTEDTESTEKKIQFDRRQQRKQSGQFEEFLRIFLCYLCSLLFKFFFFLCALCASVVNCLFY